MGSYIVNNCPIARSECHPCYQYCQDCIDCVIKQVIDLCKIKITEENNLTPKSGIYYFAKRILDKFDVEECKNE